MALISDLPGQSRCEEDRSPSHQMSPLPSPPAWPAPSQATPPQSSLPEVTCKWESCPSAIDVPPPVPRALSRNTSQGPHRLLPRSPVRLLPLFIHLRANDVGSKGQECVCFITWPMGNTSFLLPQQGPGAASHPLKGKVRTGRNAASSSALGP